MSCLLLMYFANMALATVLRAIHSINSTPSFILIDFSQVLSLTPGHFPEIQEQSGRMTTEWGLENEIGFKLLPVFFYV